MIIIKILLLLFLYLILFLLGLLLILIVAPIKGRVAFNTQSLLLNGSYLFGLVQIKYDKEVTIKIFGFKIKTNKSIQTETTEVTEDETEDDTDEKPKKKKIKSKKKFKKPTLEVIRISLETLKKLIKRIAPREAKLHLTLGLDEPYYTEMIHILSIFFFMPLNKIRDYDFSFTPVHNDIEIDFEGGAVIKFSIIQLILPLLSFFLRKPIRKYLNIRLFKRKPA